MFASILHIDSMPLPNIIGLSSCGIHSTNQNNGLYNKERFTARALPEKFIEVLIRYFYDEDASIFRQSDSNESRAA
ncbi:hypothetical protein Y017_05430 [Alcanivorax sp. 97CO-5]|nr:hypothetical protein Y017_05430 [Alcanivorax sp. 97CO-5]PKG00679.1 hypothetical protein Y019_12165 [Alcanivorax sp. 97CO-6]